MVTLVLRLVSKDSLTDRLNLSLYTHMYMLLLDDHYIDLVYHSCVGVECCQQVAEDHSEHTPK